MRGKRISNSVGVFCLALAMPWLAAGTAFSAPQENTEEAYTLGEVVVSAKGGGVEATQTVREVTAEDIKAKNARTLDEAINLLPGVNIRTGGEGVPRIDIRGFKTRHVILLLDGIPLNSAFDQQFDPTIIPVENIAGIKLTTGPSSVLYGQGGLGGVINIITKKGGSKARGMIGVETGDHAPYLGRASISGAKGKFDVFLSGSTYDRDGFPLSDDFTANSYQSSGYRVNSDKERNNFFGNVGFQATKELNFGLTFDYHQGKYGMPPTTISRSTDPFGSTVKYERIDDFEGHSIQLAGDYAPEGPFSARSWFYLNKMDETLNGYRNQTYTTLNSILNSQSTIMGFSFQPKFSFDKAGTITVGLSSERHSYDQERTPFGNNGLPRPSTKLGKDLNIYSTSIEYEVSPLKDLGIVLGYGHYFQTRAEKDDNDFSLLAGLHYDVMKDTRLKAAFQRNIRFPSLRQLYEIANNGSLTGNPNLKTEVAYLYQLGVEQKLPWNSVVGITGFYTDAKNFIEKDPSDIFQNFEKNRFTGFEIMAESGFIRNLMLRASYTYLDSKDKGDSGRDQLQYRPKDTFTFETKYDFDFGLTPYASLRYIANQYFYNDTYQKKKLNDFVVVDLKLNQKLFSDRVNLYVGVNNIFDEDYETSYGYPQPGRFIYGGIVLSM